MIEKPFYEISIRASICFFDIQVNNVSLISMNVKGQVSFPLPLNYLILESGLQEISVRIAPTLGDIILDEDTNFSCELKLFNSDDKAQPIETVAKYEIDKAILKTGIPVIEHKIKFNAKVPYKLLAWQNSIDLETVSNVRGLVEGFYKKINLLIATKQYDAFIELLSEREKNMTVSMYLSNEESKNRMNGLIEDFENGFKLAPLSFDDFLIYFSDNRVVKIVKKDMDSALRFFNKDTGEEMSLDVLFQMKQDSKELSII